MVHADTPKLPGGFKLPMVTAALKSAELEIREMYKIAGPK